MISLAELKEKAFKEKVGERLVELDYVLGWFLLCLQDVPGLANTLVFKGGTALRKIYAPKWRYSEDLDFTIHGALAFDALKSNIETWCRVTAQMSGLMINPVEMGQQQVRPGVHGNISMKLPFIGPLAKTARPRQIKLDLSFVESVLVPPQQRPVVVEFSDQSLCTSSVSVYAAEEILAEKLRSLLQRREPRDLYDAWRLLVSGEVALDLERTLAIFPEKCEARSVKASQLEDVLDDVLAGIVGEAWQLRLADQMTDLPDVRQVVRELKRELRRGFR